MTDDIFLFDLQGHRIYIHIDRKMYTLKNQSDTTAHPVKLYTMESSSQELMNSTLIHLHTSISKEIIKAIFFHWIK